MSSFFRSYSLFLWKNYRQKVRGSGDTCCEVMTPIILIALFAWLYAVTDNTTFPATTYECAGRFGDSGASDFAYLPRALNASNRRLGLVGRAAPAFATHLAFNYPGLSASDIAPLNCHSLNPNTTSTTAAAFFPSFNGLTIQFPTEAAMEAYILDEKYGTDAAHPGIELAVVFDDTSSVTTRTGAWAYRLRPNITSFPNHIPDTSKAGDPLQIGPNLDLLSNYFFSYSGTTGINVPGIVPLQLAVDRFILGSRAAPIDANAVNGEFADLAAFLLEWNCSNFNPDASTILAVNNFFSSHAMLPQRVRVAAFPTHSYQLTQFYAFVSSVLALFFVISLLFPSFNLIRGIVMEKETRLREGMRMMGMSDLAITAAWFTTYAFGIFLIIAFAIALTVKLSFFPRSDFFLLFMLFWLFGIASTALCYLISVFFSRSKVASNLGALLFIASFFPYFKVNGADASTAGKGWASLSASVAFGLALDAITTLEASNVGSTFPTSNALVKGYSVQQALYYMAVDAVLYMLVALYLSTVVPGEFGVPQPWWFPLSPATWDPAGYGGRGLFDAWRAFLKGARHAPRNNNKFSLNSDESSTSLIQGGDEQGLSALINEPASGPHFEAPSNALLDLGRAGRGLAVRGMRKAFDTPDGIKIAVAGVDLDMYEGQIFALLGHNGAGKSTLISMLTGLIPPTAGDAWTYGLSVSGDLARMRESMGVCE
jgi:ATP-binding cassette subfamily A (ABC1) protein 3